MNDVIPSDYLGMRSARVIPIPKLTPSQERAKEFLARVWNDNLTEWQVNRGPSKFSPRILRPLDQQFAQLYQLNPTYTRIHPPLKKANLLRMVLERGILANIVTEELMEQAQQSVCNILKGYSPSDANVQVLMYTLYCNGAPSGNIRSVLFLLFSLYTLSECEPVEAHVHHLMIPFHTPYYRRLRIPVKFFSGISLCPLPLEGGEIDPNIYSAILQWWPASIAPPGQMIYQACSGTTFFNGKIVYLNFLTDPGGSHTKAMIINAFQRGMDDIIAKIQGKKPFESGESVPPGGVDSILFPHNLGLSVYGEYKEAFETTIGICANELGRLGVHTFCHKFEYVESAASQESPGSPPGFSQEDDFGKNWEPGTGTP